MNCNDYGHYNILWFVHPVSSPSGFSEPEKIKNIRMVFHYRNYPLLDLFPDNTNSRVRDYGSGFRGGNWNNNSNNARVSDRNNAANTNTNRNNNNGFRCVRPEP